jgi:hypothetical protein
LISSFLSLPFAFSITFFLAIPIPPFPHADEKTPDS